MPFLCRNLGMMNLYYETTINDRPTMFSISLGRRRLINVLSDKDGATVYSHGDCNGIYVDIHISR